MKSFKDVKAKLTEGKGTAFSKEGFNELTSALLSDREYDGFEKVKIKNGELVKEKVNPVEDMRKSYVKVLTNAGLDKTEAEQFVAEKLSFTKGDVAHMKDLINEMIYHYMDAGKNYVLGEREDFQAKLSKKGIEAGTKDYPNPSKPGATVTVTVEKHDKCVVKGGCGDWLKERTHNEAK